MPIWPPLPPERPLSPAQELAAALLREREGYIFRGLPERVALVDLELAKLGVDADEPDTAADEAAPADAVEETLPADPEPDPDPADADPDLPALPPKSGRNKRG